jgi:hypothetical protein
LSDIGGKRGRAGTFFEAMSSLMKLSREILMKKLLLIALLLCSVNAFAGIYLEPYVGYLANSYDIKVSGTVSGTPQEIEDTENDSGVAFGGKVGYSIPLMAIGADYLKAGELTDIGPFVEFRLPLFLKFRATYIMSSTTEAEDDDLKFKGSGFKAGLAFSLLSVLSINLDYIATSYDELDGSIPGFETDKVDVKRSAVMASIGFPFDL